MNEDVGDRGNEPPNTDGAPGPTERHEMLANAVADGLFQIDADGRFVAVNDAFVEATNRSRADLVDEPLERAFPATDAARLSAARRSLSGSSPHTATVSASVSSTDGERKPCEVRLRLLDGEAGDAAGSVRLTDERTRDRLRQETEKFESLVQAVEEYAIFTLDPDGRIDSWNEGAARIKGYDADEVLGEHFSLFYTDEDVEAGVPEGNLAEAAEVGSLEDEGWRVRADGSRFWANVVITPVYDEDDDLRGYAKVTRDMTDRKEREDALRRERNLVTRILEANPVGIAVLDSGGEITRLNQVGAEVLGVDPAEIHDYEPDDWAIYDEDGSAVPPREWPQSRVLRTGEPIYDWRCEIERLDGTRRWISANAVPLFDDAGEIERVILTAHDITALKERQADLRRERDLVENVIEASPVMIGVFDAESRGLVRANARAEEFLGAGEIASGEYEYVGGDVPLYDEDGAPVPPEDRPFARAIKTGEPVYDWEGRMENTEGERRWFSINATPISDGEGVERIVVVGDDITRLKEQARALERQRDELELELDEMLERIDDAFYALDEEFRFTYVNDRAEELLQHDEAELFGRSVWEVFPGATETPAWESFHRALATQEPTSYEVYFDPLEFWIEANVYPSESGLSVYFRDVTDRKEREQELEQHRAVAEAASDAIVVIDEDSTIVSANPAVADILGYEPDDLEGESITTLMSEPIAEAHLDALARYLETGEETFDWNNVELPGRHRDGHDVPLAVSINEFEHAGNRYFAGIIRDVTQRKERERELERYETIVETINDGIYVVDEDGRFTMVNGEYASMTGYDREDLVGQHATEVVEEDIARKARELEADLLSGERESATLEAEIQTADEMTVAEATFALLPSGDGDYERVGVVRDITERKERERALEESERRYRTLAENFPNGVVALFDEDLRYTAVGGELFDQVDTSPDDPIGHRITERYPDDLVEVVEPYFRAAIEGEANSFEVELRGWHLYAHTLPVRDADDEVFAGMLVVQDITELRERERELQTRVSQQEAVTDLGQSALAERDLDALFDEVTDCVAETLDADYCKVLELLSGGDEVLLRSGVGWRDGLVGEATVSTGLDSQAGYTLRTEEPVVVDDMATESRFSGPELLTSHDVTSGISVVIGTPEDPWGVLGVHATDHRDFSEHDVNFVQSIGTILATAINRTERERDLELYETIVETIWDGVYALDPDGDFELVNEAFASMLGYDREELLGEPASIVHSEEMSETAREMTDEVRVGDREAATMDLELRTADGDTLPAETRFGPYPYDETRYGRTGVTRDVTERLERQRALERQREELAALNRLNQVVQEIIRALVASSSREEIERLVCERLADSESYSFAWIGEIDRVSETVALRTEAGVEGYLDDTTMSIEPGETGDGPTARAIRTREPQVNQNVLADPDYEPWHDNAREYGFRSSAAIPITYEDVLYGVLNVYSERVGAFDGHERTILTRLGNVVGHAINALERKEALMSDQVVEVEFEIPDILSLVDGPASMDGAIRFDRTVAVGGETYLVYGTVDQDAKATLEALVEATPFWEEVVILDDRFGDVSFELHLSEPPAISTVAAYGGRVRTAAIQDGDYRMTVELPPSADVRAVVGALQTAYPTLELIAQRRTATDEQSSRRVDAVLAERLTDRQRATLEAAYYAGYFDVPRKRNGEEIAESLDITAPTLHQHLRKGQRKLLAAVLEGSEEGSSA